MADEKMTSKTGDEDILNLARKRFERAQDAVSANRRLQEEDLRFSIGDSDNQYQWPEEMRKHRANRPMLTVNKIPLHINQVSNDVRQNRPSIRVRPVDDKADPDTAQVYNGVIRHIEANSDADIAYDTAGEHAIRGGEGFVRVVTDYADEDGFDQDIFIRRVKNPFTVFMDPDAQDPTGADARWAFVAEPVEKDEFKQLYPDSEPIDWSFLPAGWDRWFNDDKVLVAEYFCVETRKKKKYRWASGAVSEGDDLPEGVMPGEAPVATREIEEKYVCWYKLAGNQVLDKREWAGKYLPIVRVVGNELDINGEQHLSGLVRNAKDAQRMYNYWVSQEAEFLALWTKAPWLGYSGQFKGHEKKWATANAINHAYLEANATTEATPGQQLPLPQRVQPPVPPAGIIQAKIGAADDIKSATGQFDASLGQRSNETSGRAIVARQKEGDTATYHYVDNLARAIRQLGRILIDLIPKIYDTPRVARILGEDDEASHAQLDPNQKKAVNEVQGFDGKVQKIYNLGVGKYDVVATAGPSYTTKRQEGAEMMTQVMQGNPALMQTIGDIFFRVLDTPYADEISKRMKAMLPPQIAQAEESDGEDPRLQAMQAQMQQLMQQAQQEIQMRDQALQDMQRQLQDKAQAAEIEYRKAIEVAQVNAMSREDIEVIKGWIELQKLAMQPPPQLQAEVTESFNQEPGQVPGF